MIAASGASLRSIHSYSCECICVYMVSPLLYQFCRMLYTQCFLPCILHTHKIWILFPVQDFPYFNLSHSIPLLNQSPADKYLGYFLLLYGEKNLKAGIVVTKEIDIYNFYWFTKLSQWHRNCFHLNSNLNSIGLLLTLFPMQGSSKLLDLCQSDKEKRFLWVYHIFPSLTVIEAQYIFMGPRAILFHFLCSILLYFCLFSYLIVGL